MSPLDDIRLHEEAGRSKPNRQVVEQLLLAGADPGALIGPAGTATSALMQAARLGNSDIMRLMLPHAGADAINAQGKDGATALMLTRWADTSGHVVCADLLIAAGAALDIADMHGNTALMHAAINDRPRIVVLLLTAGAATELRNHDGRTALEAALHYGTPARQIESLLESAARRATENAIIDDFRRCANRGMPSDTQITAPARIRPRRPGTGPQGQRP